MEHDTTPLPLLSALVADRVVPVVEVEDVDAALPLARALLAGGSSAVEVTLRTPAALAAIRVIAHSGLPLVVGAGTVTAPELVGEAVRAGAAFLVSPGCTPPLLTALVRTAAEQGIPTLPGVATVSEAMVATAAGIREVKFFPAAVSGGTRFLAAAAAVLPDLGFWPTGGISADDVADYLRLPTVRGVGGSWVAPRNLVAARDWDAVTALAARAASFGTGSGTGTGLRTG